MERRRARRADGEADAVEINTAGARHLYSAVAKVTNNGRNRLELLFEEYQTKIRWRMVRDSLSAATVKVGRPPRRPETAERPRNNIRAIFVLQANPSTAWQSWLTAVGALDAENNRENSHITTVERGGREAIGVDVQVRSGRSRPKPLGGSVWASRA